MDSLTLGLQDLSMKPTWLNLIGNSSIMKMLLGFICLELSTWFIKDVPITNLLCVKESVLVVTLFQKASDGCKISFWFDCWTDFGILMNHFISPLSADELMLLVSNVITEDVRENHLTTSFVLAQLPSVFGIFSNLLWTLQTSPSLIGLPLIDQSFRSFGSIPKSATLNVLADTLGVVYPRMVTSMNNSLYDNVIEPQTATGLVNPFVNMATLLF
ncbi:hypothetical protein COLO4_32788 [Corchorus olitorius]|uniref:Uncharacterized protein n=1 Tax=Corchorus olitorius TaxID=93759 RepID=A0A1R3GY67_9ROSI|nr:hypothetical protein COLO4_32788 [Corchorus olitorius]